MPEPGGAAPQKIPRRAKRPNREGWIRQRRGPDGRPLPSQWRGELMVGYRPDGSRDMRYVSGVSQRDVQARLQRLRQRLAEGTLAPPHTRTLAEHLTRWLEDSVRPNRRSGTYRAYAKSARLYLVPQLGHVRLAALSREQIRRVYAQLAQRYARDTLRALHCALHACLADAVGLHLLARNPADGLTVPRGTGGPQQYPLDRDQARRLLAAAAADRQPWPALVAVALGTGARQGELLALRWGDVDLHRLTIRIARGRTGTAAAPVYDDPKTRAGKRTIALDPATAGMLRAWRATQAGWRLQLGPDWTDTTPGGGLVFTTDDGRPVAAQTLRGHLKRALQAAGLPPEVRWHDLRHTHATLALLAGVNPRVLADRLGHAGVAITLNLYAHVLEGMDADAATKIGRLLHGRG